MNEEKYLDAKNDDWLKFADCIVNKWKIFQLI